VFAKHITPEHVGGSQDAEMNELTGIANQQNPIDAEALPRPILTSLSRNSHRYRSTLASLTSIDNYDRPGLRRNLTAVGTARFNSRRGFGQAPVEEAIETRGGNEPPYKFLSTQEEYQP
jgi:hypothetical protein